MPHPAHQRKGDGRSGVGSPSQFAKGVGDSDTITLAVVWTETCSGDQERKQEGVFALV